ncbi:MAG: hypothetical protein QM640_16895 [Niabella sp.]
MKEPNDDFLEHIKSVLRDHEEPYDAGAWERFTEKQTTVKTRPVISFRRWAAIAAAIIAGILILSRFFNTENNLTVPSSPNIVTDHKKSDNHEPAITKPGNNTAVTPPSPAEPNGKQFAVLPPDNKIPAADTQNEKIFVIKAPGTGIILPQKPISDTAVMNKPAIAARQPQRPEKNSIDFWQNKIIDNQQTEKNPRKQDRQLAIAGGQPVIAPNSTQEKNRKWQPSLYISPVFGDKGVNMGYGFAMGYAVNDKVKISSGIAHAKVSASRSYNAQPTTAGSYAAADSKQTQLRSNALAASEETSSLQNVNGYLSGLDIPVEVSYSFNKKLYATAGVSGLVVFSDKKNYDLLTSRNVTVSVETNKGVIKEDKSVTLSNSTSTSVNSQVSNESTPFLGFYNLSIGYKQKIAGKNALSLEPFIKIPMKNISKQDLHYRASGIRLKFDF